MFGLRPGARAIRYVSARCTPAKPSPSAATTEVTASWRARAGAERSPRWRRASPTERRSKPSISTRLQSPVEPCGRGGGRHDGRAEPLERERRDEAEPVDLRLGPELDACRAGLAVELVAERGAARLEQELVAREVGERDRAPASARGCPVGAMRIRSSSKRGSVTHLRVGDGEVDDGEVELVREEAGHQRGRRRVDHDHVDLRVLARDGLEHEWDQPARRRADASQAHRAGDLVAERGHVRDDRVELRMDVPSAADDGLALLGEDAAAPIDEGDAQLPLEASHVGGHVRLHGVHRSGRRREAARFGDRDEHGELSEVHR